MSRSAQVLYVVLMVVLVPSLTTAGAGWYLMLPPTDPVAMKGDEQDLSKLIRSSAPLREWEHVASSDTADDCDAVKTVRIRVAERILRQWDLQSIPATGPTRVSSLRIYRLDQIGAQRKLSSGMRQSASEICESPS